ncbi:LPXTG cell wall anchor domain-containing protein [Schaalia sp. 19OD2882]|uniref:SdrD B-like domain-containing protein n=1 Tax=Schaalia sp. 19OD2882 TaxID=2794089 RepID=UPI001C1F146D|nr:SdrD B-like domain-containing protein [Schaalia sp. 19OD2882]QWW19732.1 LPXTG cell wall anchor domain-containing protein [Schaalia sp. 19OD2882]
MHRAFACDSTLRMRIVALIGLALVAVLTGVASLAPAFAEVNSKVVVANVKPAAAGDADATKQIFVWDAAQLTFDWDATEAAAVAGDSFRVVFAPHFRAVNREKLPMEVNTAGGQVSVGQCAVSWEDVSCTFDEGLTKAVETGAKATLKGSIFVKVEAVKPTEGPTAPMVVNGESTEVPLPSGKPIVPSPYYQWGFGTDLLTITRVGQTNNVWAVALPTDLLAQKVEGFTTDGSVSTLRVHAQLGEGQVFDLSDPTMLRLNTWQTAAPGVPPRTRLMNLSGYRHQYAKDWTFAAQVNPDGSLDVEATGAFPPSTNLTLQLPITFVGGAQAGLKYTNTVSIEGSSLKTTATEWYTGAAEATPQMAPGQGTFKVRTFITGNGAYLVPNAHPFDVDVTMVLPRRADSYTPAWVAPKGFTIGEDAVTVTGSMRVLLGSDVLVDPLVTVPAGTRVTLTDKVRPSSTPAGVAWEAPSMSVATTDAGKFQDTWTFVVADRKVTQVHLTTSASKLALVSVGDRVWEDLDRDGIQADAELEPGIANVRLTVSRSDGLAVMSSDGTERTDPTTTTDAQGVYRFTDLPVLPAGVSYVVSVDAASLPAHYEPTPQDRAGADRGKDSDAVAGRARAVPLTSDGDADMSLDFGYVRNEARIEVETRVGERPDPVARAAVDEAADPDASSSPQSGSGAEGPYIVQGSEGVTLNVIVTNAGTVDLHGLQLTSETLAGEPLGNLSCVVDGVSVPAGKLDPAWVLRPQARVACSAALPRITAPHSDRVTVRAVPAGGGEALTASSLWHARPAPSVAVGGLVWNDLDRDGIQDEGEPGIKGVGVALTGPQGGPVTDVFGHEVADAVTVDNGTYVFDKLPALSAGQTYTVTVATPQGMEPTIAGAGDADKDSSTGSATSRSLSEDGARDMSLGFGFVAPAAPSPSPAPAPAPAPSPSPAPSPNPAPAPKTDQPAQGQVQPAPERAQGQKASKLPVTGSASAVVLAAAVMAALAGGLVLLMRRRMR